MKFRLTTVILALLLAHQASADCTCGGNNTWTNNNTWQEESTFELPVHMYDSLIWPSSGSAIAQSGSISLLASNRRVKVYSGGSNSTANLGGARFASTTAAGNVGSGEDDLHSYSGGSSELGAALDSLRFRAFGTFASNLNNKRIRARLVEGSNNTAIFDSGAVQIEGGSWSLTCETMRKDTTDIVGSCMLSTSSATLPSAVTTTSSGTFTWANGGTLKVTAEATDNDDVVELGWKGEWSPAP